MKNLKSNTQKLIQHIKSDFDSSKPLVFWIDLFSGAGGTSTGIHLSNQSNVYVIACVNHDINAIKSHKKNHPKTLHFTEDIRDFKVVEQLKYVVQTLQKEFENSKLKIWASLECTNFSKAKGGLPRDADSRTLAEHMFMYMVLKPVVFWFENVREFMAWGPLDENGKPLSKCNGKDYLKWVEKLKSFGYNFDWKILNAADFGAYQSRERLFLQFPIKGYSFAWPEQTHSKKGGNGGFFDLPKWKAVKEVLDLKDEGISIFHRKKPLSENTEKRILAGLEKYVAKGENLFIKKYFSGRPKGKVISVNEPSGTVTTAGTQAIIKTIPFTMQYNSGNDIQRVKTIDEPVNTITTGNSHALVTSIKFLTTYYGKSNPKSINNPSPVITTKDRIAKINVDYILDYQYNSKPHSIDEPLPTILTKDKFAKVLVEKGKFIMNNYSNGGEYNDIDSACSALVSNPKQNLISAKWIMNTNFNNIGKSIEEPSPTITASRRHSYIVNANSSTSPPVSIENSCPSITQRTHIIINPGWGGHPTSTDKPCCTIIARQDKTPLYLLALEHGEVIWAVYDTDSPTMVKIKEFMVLHGITDIKMRMLKIPELLQIQGFPKNYKLVGTQTEQKKYIGNAVEVNMARALAFSDYQLELKLCQVTNLKL